MANILYVNAVNGKNDSEMVSHRIIINENTNNKSSNSKKKLIFATVYGFLFLSAGAHPGVMTVTSKCPETEKTTVVLQQKLLIPFLREEMIEIPSI